MKEKQMMKSGYGQKGEIIDEAVKEERNSER